MPITPSSPATDFAGTSGHQLCTDLFGEDFCVDLNETELIFPSELFSEPDLPVHHQTQKKKPKRIHESLATSAVNYQFELDHSNDGLATDHFMPGDVILPLVEVTDYSSNHNVLNSYNAGTDSETKSLRQKKAHCSGSASLDLRLPAKVQYTNRL